MQLDLNPIIAKVRATIETHKLPEEGAFVRFLWQSKDGSRKMGVNEYGCADVANIRYMIGDLPRNEQERMACVKVLQDFQDPETGLFFEGTHHALHCTAHCTAALELFDVRPKYEMPGIDEWRTCEGVCKLLENLKWLENPWPQAHEGAGIFATMILTGNASREWQDAYFGWLESHTDPEYGMSNAGTIQNGKAPAFHHLNGWFHYLFNFSFANRPFPMAEKLIDTCIDLYKNKQLAEDFGRRVGFSEIDWVFTLHRAIAQTGYRFAESKALLREFAEGFVQFLNERDMNTDDQWNDMHMLFGAVCALAELQIALPGELRSDYPLRQVLDRRPFI